MSRSQPTLDDFRPAGEAKPEPDREADTPANPDPTQPSWNPDATDDTRACGNCGAHVSRDFIRVFGTDDGVEGCLNCTTRADVKNGAGVLGPAETPRRISR